MITPAQSFACTIVEAQYSPSPAAPGADARLGALLARLDALFAAFFAAELLVAAFARWLVEFLRDPWSWLDAAVVTPPPPPSSPRFVLV